MIHDVRNSRMLRAIETFGYVDALLDCHSVMAHGNFQRVTKVDQYSKVTAARFFQ